MHRVLDFRRHRVQRDHDLAPVVRVQRPERRQHTLPREPAPRPELRVEPPRPAPRPPPPPPPPPPPRRPPPGGGTRGRPPPGPPTPPRVGITPGGAGDGRAV